MLIYLRRNTICNYQSLLINSVIFIQPIPTVIVLGLDNGRSANQNLNRTPKSLV